MKTVLRMTDEEIAQMEEQIQSEPPPTLGVGGQPLDAINNQQ